MMSGQWAAAAREEQVALNGAYAPKATRHIDLNAAPYNALPGEDITDALQQAVNDACATEESCRLYFSRTGETYYINGPIQTGTTFDHTYEGQILIPPVLAAKQFWPGPSSPRRSWHLESLFSTCFMPWQLVTHYWC